MASHALGDEGGCKRGFQRTSYIASHVSHIVFDTVDFPYDMKIARIVAIQQY